MSFSSRILQALTITMRKHPLSFKLGGSLAEPLEAAKKVETESVLFDGNNVFFSRVQLEEEEEHNYSGVVFFFF